MWTANGENRTGADLSVFNSVLVVLLRENKQRKPQNREWNVKNKQTNGEKSVTSYLKTAITAEWKQREGKNHTNILIDSINTQKNPQKKRQIWSTYNCIQKAVLHWRTSQLIQRTPPIKTVLLFKVKKKKNPILLNLRTFLHIHNLVLKCFFFLKGVWVEGLYRVFVTSLMDFF